MCAGLKVHAIKDIFRISLCVNRYDFGRIEKAARLQAARRDKVSAIGELKRFLKGKSYAPDTLLFHTKRGSPIQETMILRQCLHPAVRLLGFPKAGMRAFRRGCNRRWELVGINRAVLRQQMGTAHRR